MVNYRRRVVVDGTVQWAIARRIFFHWVGFFLLFLSINAMIRILMAMPDDSWTEAAQGALTYQIPQMVVMMTILPIFIRDTLKLSNRFAGPMHRLRVSLKAVAEGTPLKPIKFRTGDFWLEVADQFNAVLRRIDTLEARNRELEDELRRLRSGADAHAEMATAGSQR